MFCNAFAFSFSNKRLVVDDGIHHQNRDSIIRITAMNPLDEKWETIKNNYEENVLDPVVLSLSAKVYEKPDTNKLELGNIYFDFSAPITAKGSITYRADYEINYSDGTKTTFSRLVYKSWYQIIYLNKPGYIKASDMAEHSFRNNDETKLFIQNQTRSANILGDEDNRTTARIYKYNLLEKKFTDTLEVALPGNYKVQFNAYFGWNNVQSLIWISYNSSSSPYKVDVFVTDANGRLNELIRSERRNKNDGEKWESVKSTVYLPLKFADNSIRLVENGDFMEIVDYNIITINKLFIPASVKVPVKLLVVKLKETESGKNNLANNKTNTLKKSAEYYKWNGKELELILKQ